MKPQNKFQRQVIEASRKLPKLTPAQIQWGYDHAIKYTGRRTSKGVTTCTRCGHSWKSKDSVLSDTMLGNECPHCHTHLDIEVTRKRTFKECAYFTVITACGGFQVLRHILIRYTAKIGKPTTYSHCEVMQRWVAPDSRYVTFARLRQAFGKVYYDLWLFDTSLELRRENHIYNWVYYGEVYPRMSIIPELKKRGFKGEFFGQKPLDFFRAILTDNKVETLLKTGQTALMQFFLDEPSRKVSDYWASIRICLRNGYKVSKAVEWCDYIDSLRCLGKDVRNAKYVCPADLMEAHDKAADKLMKRMIRNGISGNIPAIIEKEYKYMIAKRMFFGLVFSDGQIRIHVIESVKEMIEEGKRMHHCVGNYYDKNDSLILSATMNGKRIETVEVSLRSLKVVQSRGVCNTITDYHDRIINLVTDNMDIIRKRKENVA